MARGQGGGDGSVFLTKGVNVFGGGYMAGVWGFWC